MSGRLKEVDVRVIVHLSDLHFGHINTALVKPLLYQISAIKPHLIAVSGDLTQRARTSEFKAARRFLDALPAPVIVVPGNHDIPSYNLFARFFLKLSKYGHHITADLYPYYQDEEIAVLGLNTARSFVIKGGRINKYQVSHMQKIFCILPEEVVKIVVTHHPFDVPEHLNRAVLVGRSRMAMKIFAERKIQKAQNCGRSGDGKTNMGTQHSIIERALNP
jgi:3',5'-cyclic AMP phosphodiesterase CpdA